jgi:hypothetical protein
MDMKKTLPHLTFPVRERDFSEIFMLNPADRDQSLLLSRTAGFNYSGEGEGISLSVLIFFAALRLERVMSKV